ncbi:hypothetical protein SUGI_0414130 [Cryptomeria japonica]|nr:hypothetical protein SUGI_0414130 [Cryptomeria japonica]
MGTVTDMKKDFEGGGYANVTLSDRGKEVALFLCVDDWNYEVVYWLLNSWSNTETMDVGDVRGGNIPFSIAAKFEKMNKLIGHVARRLGVEGGKALEKARNTTYSGKDSIKEVLSGMVKIVTKEEDIVQFMSRATWRFTGYEGDEYCVPDSVRTEDVVEAFWSFVCDSFAGYVVEVGALTSLLNIREMQTRSTSHSNLKIATSILLCLSDFRTDIIHEPMAHDCKGSCAHKILLHAAEKAAGNSQTFNEMLKSNAMWRSYSETGNYGVLDKLLVIVAKCKYDDRFEDAGKIIEILMLCGAQLGGRYAIGKYKNKTVLHSVAKFHDEGVGKEVAQALLRSCDEQSINEFVNAADERGMTALHIASEKGNARICELLVDRGTVVTAQDKNGMTALHYALEGRIGDIGTEIAQVLIHRCDQKSIYEFVNAADDGGRTALHIASEKGKAHICGLLVDRGAVVTPQDEKGMTALHYAFEGEIDKVVGVGTEIAQSLLRSCDEQSIYGFLNATDEEGRTALHIASEKGKAHFCGLLVDRGALVSAQDSKGMTALHYAFKGEIGKVKGAGTEIAQTLLCRCDQSISEFVNTADETGKTALHRASKKGNVRSCGLLVEHGAVVTVQDNKDHGGKTSLHGASEKGNSRICRLLVDCGASVTAQDENGMTALHYAFEREIDKIVGVGTEIIKDLLSRCGEQRINDFVNATDERGRTALHGASEKGDVDACELLIDHGALVTARDKMGMTALHYAFEGGVDKVKDVGTKIVQALLCRYDGQSIHEFVNATDERGRTALHGASEKGNTRICKLLVDRGAFMNVQDKRGMTALHYAFEGGLGKDIDVATEVAEALLRRCNAHSLMEFVNTTDTKGRTALHRASKKGNTRIGGLLVDHGASVTVQDNKGMTALHYAFQGGIDKVIDVGTNIAGALLRRCDQESIYELVNATDGKGRTALHYASENGNARMCELLVEHGALMTAQDITGMTALHYSFEGGIDKDIDVGTEIAEALLLRCDELSIYEFVNTADARGRTALHSASDEGNARICRLLVDHGALALHYALGGGTDEVIDVLVKCPHVTESLNLKDKRGYTPLEITLVNMDYKSTAKLLLKSEEPKAFLEKTFANMDSNLTAKLLLNSNESEAYLDMQGYLDIAVPLMDYESTARFISKSKEPETYFNKVDQEHLLRYSLLLGSVDIVDKLFKKGIKLPVGDCDEDGKTAMHLAAMCDNESNAIEMISFKMRKETTVNLENMVAKRDRGGRTVLHDAALNGHAMLCSGLLELNSELIYIKDSDDRNPLYDAVTGAYKDTTLYKQLLKAYLKKDMSMYDLVDRSGLTPLHVAASQGNIEVLKELLSKRKIKTGYLPRGDILAQTALHKALKHGDVDTVVILLKHGAHPLRERDCDGRTALHYAVQAETGDKQQLAEMLLWRCESEEEKSLLLWASAAGLGTADQGLSKDDPLYIFLDGQKKRFKDDNLLRTAASLGDIEMTKELISRGYQTGDIRDLKWKKHLPTKKQENVEKVLRQIDIIKEQGNDKPAISDSLGRLDYALGLAALFLNPYIKPPIAVGITGSWGTGKSSLMLQTERILVTTAAQMILLPSSKLSSSDLQLPAIKPCEFSRKGKSICEHIYRQIKCGKRINRNIFLMLWDYIRSMLGQTGGKKIQKKLKKFLNEYDNPKNLKVFKALAAMDSSDMLGKITSAEEKVPAVLTVQYNAWKYRNDTEALAGIAVEVTKELEGIMTQAQWLNTCWRNTWIKNKYALWIEIFFPSLLALVLVGSFTWIAWVLFDSDRLKEWGKAKYAWPPAALVIIVWTLTKSTMGVLKPVSTQLMQYISFPDHTDKLGYQERVISDISFLKDELGKKAHWVFIVFAWMLTAMTVLWGLITGSCITSLLFHHRSHEKAIEAPMVAPALGSDLRIIVFVDDLDRCQESVILQVLSAVNLVLAECKISVVIGMDKKLIKRAIIKKYKDVFANKSLETNQELAEIYLEKIIQLPLDLPDPGDEESRRFLRGQLGVLDNENLASKKDNSSSSNGGGEREAVLQNIAAQAAQGHSINITETEDMFRDQERSVTGRRNLPERSVHAEARGEDPAQSDGDAGKEKPSSPILVREMLFVRYSRGEEDAFLYFQGLATGCRKHPREWKRILNYHRLVWCIFSVSNEAKNFYGWQVELITWIFICWEWQECMNLVIKNWKEIVDLKTDAPSLLMIVKHLMNTKATSYENSENISSEQLTNSMENKLDALEKSLAELKREMKELKELVADDLKKDIKELQKQLSDELKEDIKEAKEQNTKKESGKNEDIKEIKVHVVNKESRKNGEKWNLKNRKLQNENWERMKSTLEKYDVSMKGIQAFQKFRFYCIAGYLPRLGKD